jgi:LPXTG-motif cell wall-anchored protein
MPTTGQSETPMLLTMLLAALGLLGIGVLARRAKTTGR